MLRGEGVRRKSRVLRTLGGADCLDLNLRSNGGERELPDIVADLKGGGLRVIQVGFVDSVPVKGTELARLRTRFLSVPDAPVSRIEISLFGGKKRGLLENSRNLCQTDRKARTPSPPRTGRCRTPAR